MSTYKELVYMVLDEIKNISDDSFFTEDHVIFLLNKYRTFLLKQRYADVKKQIPESNYQTICLTLSKYNNIDDICGTELYLRSNEKIPNLMKIGSPMVYPIDYYQGTVTYISRERMKYVGYNKYLQNIIYVSLGPDNHLYFKSSNPQYLYMEKAKMTGVFEDSEAASKFNCQEEDEITSCDILDKDFPLESALIPTMLELVVKELLGASYRPEDSENNATDDLANMDSFIRRNMKSDLVKQMES